MTVVVEHAGQGTDTVYAYSNYTMPAGRDPESLWLRDPGHDQRWRSGWIYGNANDNIFDGRGGLGRMFGGLGNDTYYVEPLQTYGGECQRGHRHGPREPELYPRSEHREPILDGTG